MRSTVKLLTAIVGCELVGLAGTPFTVSSIASWYQYLNKPFFSPPNWIFGPVWTVLYLMMGVSAYLIWNKGLNHKGVKQALLFFFIQLGFNFMWSIIFFGWHAPLWALVDIGLLWVFILLTMIKFMKISKTAGYLLIPYLLWVSFAAILNFFIVMLNP